MNSVANVLLALCLLYPGLAFGDERPDLQQIQDVVQRFYEAWNQQDFVAVENLIGESVVELDMRSRQEPQTWILRKVQSREEFLDGIIGEWTGGDAWNYDQEIHQYIKQAEFFDVFLWGDRAMAITQEHLVGVSGPVGDEQYSAWLLDRADDGWAIAGVLHQVPAEEYKTVSVEPRSERLRVRIFVDGGDEVFADDEGLWVEHRYGALPGRHEDGDGFSPVEVNGVRWQPIWQGDRTRKVYFADKVAWPSGTQYRLVKHEARDVAQLEREPQAPGDTLSIVFADQDSGADWYDVEVRWGDEVAKPGAGLPEPSPPGREDLLIEVLFNGEIRDTSPHQRSLKNVKVAFTEDRTGDKDGAGYFDGEAVVDIEGFLLDDPFSVSIWAKYDEIETRPYRWNNCIWAQDNGGGVRVFQLSTLGRRVTWHRMQDDEDDLHSKLLLRKGRWYHFAAVFDGDYHRLFVNGVLQEQKQSAVETSPDQPIYIGAKNLDQTDFFFTGALDDARLYGRVLTTAEISALYQGLTE